MTTSVPRFVSFAFASADVLVEADIKGVITFSMGACRALFGMDDVTLLHRPFLDLFDPNDRGIVHETLQRLWPGARSGPLIVKLVCKGKREACRSVVLHAFRLPDSGAGFSCTISQTTLAQMLSAGNANRDTQSGLLDGEAFSEVAAEALRAARKMGDALAMTLLDIPQLHSQPPGTPLIRRIGDLLRSASLDGIMAGRLAETRFGVIHKAGEDGLDSFFDEIRKEGEKSGAALTVNHREIGIAGSGMGEDDALKAIRFAVNHFARLKKGEQLPDSLDGLFERMVDDTIQRMSSFIETVRNNDFALTYQPVVDIATGKLHHFEVLSRFEDGNSPIETIQFAEQIEMIERFDLAVCSRVIDVLNATLPQNPGLAINLSGSSVSSPAFMRVLTDLLHKNQHLAGRLSFEITESAELTDLKKADKALQSLRKAGFHLYLDDFGAGSASFQYLQALRVDGLKIDGAYIRRLGDSVRDHSILVGMVRICKSLALESVAEQVEDRDTAVALYEMGVRFGQGWFYSKPLSEPIWRPTPEMAVAPRVAPLQPAPGPSQNAKRKGETQSWG